MKGFKGFLTVAFVGALLAICPAAHADFISWTYQATVSNIHNGVPSPDLLGIDGETVSFSLIFDDSKLWQDVAGDLYFLPDTFTATMTGGHTIALNTDQVAAAYTSDCCGLIADQPGSDNYVDFIIDGKLTLMSGNGLNIPNGPSAGERLRPEHLPTSLQTFSFFEYADAGGLTARYNLVAESISISVSPVPEPGTWLLLASGMAGLGAVRWWRGRA